MPHINLKKVHTLEQQIAASRRKLQDLYDNYGCTNAEVLAVGIELDELLNQYQNLSAKTKSLP